MHAQMVQVVAMGRGNVDLADFLLHQVEGVAETPQLGAGVASRECPGSTKVNRKFKGPDGVMIDVRARGWDEQIKARMPLYQLTPASSGSE